MYRLQDKNRKYKRFNHTPAEKQYLDNRGLRAVQSSNVSAVGRVNDDLIIRFHNGSVYRYPDNGHLLDDMLASSSKGKFVWDRLRGRRKGRHMVPYDKPGGLGKIPLPDDIDVTDEEIFAELDRRYVSDMTEHLTAAVTQAVVFSAKLGMMMNKIDIGGVVIYQPLT